MSGHLNSCDCAAVPARLDRCACSPTHSPTTEHVFLYQQQSRITNHPSLFTRTYIQYAKQRMRTHGQTHGQTDRHTHVHTHTSTHAHSLMNTVLSCVVVPIKTVVRPSDTSCTQLYSNYFSNGFSLAVNLGFSAHGNPHTDHRPDLAVRSDSNNYHGNQLWCLYSVPTPW